MDASDAEDEGAASADAVAVARVVDAAFAHAARPSALHELERL
ncbi:MAG: hypothetical protein ACLVKA_08765 [Collinsella aerofaciens]